ncbi:MAG: hypothetical protein ACFCUR_03740 [Rhodomicrobiaceae bacterium]
MKRKKNNLEFLLNAIQKDDNGLLMIAAIADAISANCRFNSWMLSKEKELDIDEWFSIAEKYDELFESCRYAIENLRTVQNSNKFVKMIEVFCSEIELILNGK